MKWSISEPINDLCVPFSQLDYLLRSQYVQKNVLRNRKLRKFIRKLFCLKSVLSKSTITDLRPDPLCFHCVPRLITNLQPSIVKLIYCTNNIAKKYAPWMKKKAKKSVRKLSILKIRVSKRKPLDLRPTTRSSLRTLFFRTVRVPRATPDCPRPVSIWHWPFDV